MKRRSSVEDFGHKHFRRRWLTATQKRPQKPCLSPEVVDKEFDLLRCVRSVENVIDAFRLHTRIRNAYHAPRMH